MASTSAEAAHSTWARAWMRFAFMVWPYSYLRRFPKSALSCLREAVPPLARRVTGAMKVSGWLRELDR